jgi:large subunit ribosomal protein L24
MKSAFNKNWKASKQPRKQVKYASNAPNHIRRKFLSANLDKELRKKHGIRNIEVRKGDEVKIMRGSFKGKQGKVGIVDLQNIRVQIDGVQRSRLGGEKVATWFNPSNIKIIQLELSDARRMKRAKNIGKEVVKNEKTEKVKKEKEE